MAEELVKENERLALEAIVLEERCRAAERERDALRDRMREGVPKSPVVIEELHQVEDELNTLANLHTANWQLHLKLVLARVLDSILEICINLVGTERALIYMVDEEKRTLVPVRAHNCDDDALTVLPIDGSEIGKAIGSGEVELSDRGDFIAVVPLSVEDRVVAAVVIRSLLAQKNGLQKLDHELFELIRRQGATALYGAYLASVSPRLIEEKEIKKTLARHSFPGTG
ncbi:MAG: GAF domain-containing protein [bacterium]